MHDLSFGPSIMNENAEKLLVLNTSYNLCLDSVTLFDSHLPRSQRCDRTRAPAAGHECLHAELWWRRRLWRALWRVARGRIVVSIHCSIGIVVASVTLLEQHEQQQQ